MTVRVLGAGAAAPGLRVAAGEVGAAWGRSGRGRIAACAPDEDTLTLAWQAASRALASRILRRQTYITVPMPFHVANLFLKFTPAFLYDFIMTLGMRMRTRARGRIAVLVRWCLSLQRSAEHAARR